MRKLFLIVLLAVSASIYANAHDVIVKRDGERIQAMVMEVNATSVKFKRMDNPNGPVYICNLSDVQSIAYENGKVETYGEQSREQERYYADYNDVRYRDIKGWYNPRDYESYSGEPYSPILSGLSSWIIPGLGQCFDGEWCRGLGIMAANLGFATVEFAGLSLAYYYGQPVHYTYDYNDPIAIGAKDPLRSLVCVGGTLLVATCHAAFNIWNIFDAVNIAKVKNLYYQDASRNTASFNLHFEPELAFSPSFGNSLEPVAGLKLSVCF